MPDRMTSEEIDRTLRRTEKDAKRTGILTFLSAASLALIVVLFFTWVIFGQRNISAQTHDIARRTQRIVREGHRHLFAKIEHLTTSQNVGDRTIVCLLSVPPEQRTEDVTQRCLAAARDGRTHLPKLWEPTWEPSWAPTGSSGGRGDASGGTGTGGTDGGGGGGGPTNPGCEHAGDRNPHC